MRVFVKLIFHAFGGVYAIEMHKEHLGKIFIVEISESISEIFLKFILRVINNENQIWNSLCLSYIHILIKWLNKNYKKGMNINCLIDHIRWDDISENDKTDLFEEICIEYKKTRLSYLAYLRKKLAYGIMNQRIKKRKIDIEEWKDNSEETSGKSSEDSSN